MRRGENMQCISWRSENSWRNLGVMRESNGVYSAKAKIMKRRVSGIAQHGGGKRGISRIK
jgi:hypothetical protein